MKTIWEKVETKEIARQLLEVVERVSKRIGEKDFWSDEKMRFILIDWLVDVQ